MGKLPLLCRLQPIVPASFTVARDSLAAALNDSDAFVCSSERDAEQSVRSSKSSSELLLLIESIVGRCQLLPRPESRLPFFEEIVLVLLDDYLEWIKSSARELIDSAATSLSLLGAEVVKLDEEGVLSVCRWIRAVDHVINVLEDWAETLVGSAPK